MNTADLTLSTHGLYLRQRSSLTVSVALWAPLPVMATSAAACVIQRMP